MTKLESLRRFLIPCTGNSPSPPPAAKKHISTSLRDDLDEKQQQHYPRLIQPQPQEAEPPSSCSSPAANLAPPRPSRTMVIATIFGHGRGGHVWFCVQQDRLKIKPALLLELSIPTSAFIQEMQCGLVRIALEFNAAESDDPELGRCPLRSVPLWTLFCNGRKLGFAARRKPTQQTKIMLKTMQNVTVGAGVIPCKFHDEKEVMYMRANYECVLGSADSESFHLINPDQLPGQELSVFLLRTR
ncbi:hypothetical protein SASPL_108711 [Salvia splendens]|uniref:Protein MIZU-KUSSEI 1 n=1 Tax=Salvia splendens TaxID=180675 RepID=A0A8X8YF83_SALSN|nr:protein MIZU-KUSSEI 1-like [Salvia splendens]KAG6430639.1 hypothetical protein SASPL_108711 [Salvia splendens]